MGDSIRGELQRRQELLRSAGNYANIHDYEKARAAGAPLEPLPSLVMVIDEFSELLTAKPDFIDMFIQIGRIGRSLGVHLLLASQRLEEGKLRGLDTYLSYRIGLRTFSAAESRTAIGVPGRLPPAVVPGSGYPQVRHGRDGPVQGGVRLGYVPHRRSAVPSAGQLPDASGGRCCSPRPRCRWRTRPRPPRRAGADAGEDDALADTVLDVIVRRLEGQGAAGPPGVAAAAGRAAARWTSCCPALAPTPGPRSHRTGVHGAGRARRAARPGRQAVRAAPRRAVPGLLRRGAATCWSSAVRSPASRR